MIIPKQKKQTRLPRNAFLEKQLQTQWSKRLEVTSEIQATLCLYIIQQLQINLKIFRDFKGIRTHGLCISNTVLYQLSYADQYIGSRQIG